MVPKAKDTRRAPSGRAFEPSAEWSHKLAQSVPYSIIAYGGEHILYANQATAEITGYSIDELLSLTPGDLVDPEFLDKLPIPDTETGLYPPFQEPVEIQILRKDGSARWVSVTNNIQKYGDGVVGVATAVDISLRYRAQGAVLRRLELENALTDISRVLLSLTPDDLETGIFYTLERFVAAARAECTFLLLFDETHEMVAEEYFHQGEDCSRSEPENKSIADYGIDQVALARGEPLELSGSAGEKAAFACCPRSGLAPRSSTLMPLLAGGSLIGVLGHVWASPTSETDSEDLRVLRVGAEIVSSAVHRLRIETELRDFQERFDLAQKAGHSVAWEWDPSTDRMILSRSAGETFGFPENLLPRTGRALQRRIPSEDHAVVANAIKLALKEGQPYSIEHRFLMHDGETVIWLSARGQPFVNEKGRVTRVMGVSADITDHKAAEQALNEERRRAEVTLAAIGDGVIRTDLQGRVDYLNPAAERLTGWSNSEAKSRFLSEVYRAAEDGTGRQHSNPVHECLERGTEIASPNPCSLFNRNGGEFAVRDSAAPIRSEAGGIVGAVLIFKDVTRIRGLEREMAFQASHDTLTGLLNRREFESRVNEALTNATFTDRHHALCYMDLDAFKVVNDTCGHSVGDSMLQQLAGILEATARGTDILARLGGDEFGVLLTDCTHQEAYERALHFLEAVRGFRFLWEDRIFEVGISIGIVPVDSDSPIYIELLGAADAACFVAKEQGRNRIHLSHPDDQDVAARYHETQWIQRLNQAIDRDLFVLHWQTIIPLRDAGEPEIVEVLIRLDEGDEIVTPGLFIPAAERYRMMPLLDQWVIRKTLETLREAPGTENRDRHKIAINLSGQSMADSAVLDTILDGLENNHIDPTRVCFEITETAAISNLGAAQAFIGVLSGMGCSFALDDFGSGLSSFRYLRDLDVKYLKVEGSLVRDIATDPIQREMVEAIHRIGKAMGLRTVGECVEDEITLRTLREIGFDYAQGFAINRPGPVVRLNVECRNAADSVVSGPPGHSRND